MNEKRRHGRPRSRFTAQEIIGYPLIIGTLVGLPMLILSLLSPAKAGEYSIYNGPILPLSSISGGEQLEVERDVTLDFGIYGEELKHYYDEERVRVTDLYTLTNPTAEDITVELSWGFRTRFADDLPTLLVNGEPANAAVWGHVNAEGGLGGAGTHNFESWRKALTERDFLAEAMEEAPQWDVPVKVYHFYNIAYEGDLPYPPILDISYNYGETTCLWTRSYGSTGSDKKKYHIGCDIDKDVWLYVIGDDLVDMTVAGSKMHTMGVYQSTEVEGVTWELETYESTFMECLWEAVQDYEFDWEETPGSGVELVTREMLFDFAMKATVGSGKQEPGGVYLMDTLLGNTYDAMRMIYWVFPVEIPAGGSATFSVTYEKESSYNTGDKRHGYDIATTLGSNLNFIQQRVKLVNTELVTIAEEGEAQNMGFKPGVQEVVLDMTQERYFVDLLRVEAE